MAQQSGRVPSGQYDAFRENGFPTYYGEVKTAWQADILEAGLIFAFCILALAFFAILPGVQGKQRIFNFVWIVVSLFIGAVILVTNFSLEWEASSTHATTKYKAGTGKDINASIGVHIGLRGVNITLKGEPEHQLNETINYNEEFSWSWRQGRLGFGPFASEFNQEYRAAQFRGVPLPILWIAEYFTFDGEGIRWGRLYRESGLYAHMLLWLAFPLWLLSNILFLVLLRYGAYFLIMTGTSMCTANVIKHFLRNPLELTIPFSAEHILVFHYGTAFWLCLGTGFLCILCGFIILIMDLRLPEMIANFFGVDVRQDNDQIQREGTKLSQSSYSSSNTADTELTEIVEIDSDGKVSKTSQVREGNGANQSRSGQADDAEWSECSSESELEPTDDENDDYRLIDKRPASKGLLGRFQQPRQRPSPFQSNNNRKGPFARQRFQDNAFKSAYNARDRVSPSNVNFKPKRSLFNGKVSPTGLKGLSKTSDAKRVPK